MVEQVIQQVPRRNIDQEMEDNQEEMLKQQEQSLQARRQIQRQRNPMNALDMLSYRQPSDYLQFIQRYPSLKEGKIAWKEEWAVDKFKEISALNKQDRRNRGWYYFLDTQDYKLFKPVIDSARENPGYIRFFNAMQWKSFNYQQYKYMKTEKYSINLATSFLTTNIIKEVYIMYTNGQAAPLSELIPKILNIINNSEKPGLFFKEYLSNTQQATLFNKVLPLLITACLQRGLEVQEPDENNERPYMVQKPISNYLQGLTNIVTANKTDEQIAGQLIQTLPIDVSCHQLIQLLTQQVDFMNKFKHWNLRGYDLGALKFGITVKNQYHDFLFVLVVPYEPQLSESNRVIDPSQLQKRNLYVLAADTSLTIPRENMSVTDFIITIGFSYKNGSPIRTVPQPVLEFYIGMMFYIPDTDIKINLNKFVPGKYQQKPTNLRQIGLTGSLGSIGIALSKNSLVDGRTRRMEGQIDFTGYENEFKPTQETLYETTIEQAYNRYQQALGQGSIFRIRAAYQALALAAIQMGLKQQYVDPTYLTALKVSQFSDQTLKFFKDKGLSDEIVNAFAEKIGAIQPYIGKGINQRMVI